MTRRIPISNTNMFAIVDDDDYVGLNQHTWYARGKYGVSDYTSYAYCTINGVPTPMHFLVLGQNIDHKNRIRLDNRRDNLRPASKSQNAANSSKMNAKSTSTYKGVCWKSREQKWSAQIIKDGRYYYIGVFNSEINAARAYDKKALELFGEFAYKNFP